MARLQSSDCEKLLDVSKALYSSGPHGDLRPYLLASLQSLIPHELGACHWIQASRHQIVAWYEPHQRDLPATNSEFWRLTRTHPLNPVLRANPAKAWKLSDVISRRAFLRTELYEILYRPLALDCEITALLPDKQARDTYFLISLHRHRVDFTERDRAILNLLLPHVAHAQARLAASPLSAVAGEPASDEALFFDWLRRKTAWQLSRRESDVLFWISKGKTNDEIGSILGITGRTAETHALRLYPKIGVENRYSAIATLNHLALMERQ